MARQLPVVFLSFANDPYEKLLELGREEDRLTTTLRSRAKRLHFFLEKQSIAEKEHLANAITQHWKDIVLLHFSGHANPEALSFSDGMAQAEGLSQLLQLQNHLHCIFLNGCSTYGHVKQYLEAGVPVVIATNAPVEDRIAADFSIFFYEALSLEGVTIRDAFELARGKVLLLHNRAPGDFFQLNRNNDPAKRGIALQSDAAESFKWGIYYLEEEALNWTLPFEVVAATSPIERVDLTASLSDSFMAYCREIQVLRSREDDGEYINLGEYRDNIIKCLPAPLGIHVRKLFIRLPEDLQQVTMEHLQQALNTYNVMMELLAYTMMAQLWEACLTQDLEIRTDRKAEIRQFLQLNSESRALYNFVNLIRSIRQIFDDNQVEYFIEELKTLRKIINEDAEFVAGHQFMESIKWLLLKNRMDQHALPNNYLQAEYYISVLLEKLGFCAKYRLTAIKRIDLIQPRHKTTPVYSHTLVPLIACGTYDADMRPYQDYTYSRAVIMLKSLKDVRTFLAITPFIIDKNAYDDKSKKSSIFFFLHYDRTNKALVFQNAERAQDKLLIKKTTLPERKLSPIQQYHNEIVDQFEAFTALLFNQSIDEL